jgi:hypothetical protein
MLFPVCVSAHSAFLSLASVTLPLTEAWESPRWLRATESPNLLLHFFEKNAETPAFILIVVTAVVTIFPE